MAHSAKLSSSEFQSFQKLLEKEYGLPLGPERSEKFSGIIHKRMRECRIVSIPDYYAYLNRGAESQPELKHLIEHITIGETYFFRNSAHMEVLRKHVLPEVFRDCTENKRPLKIWSAGCATGEEVYTLAILIFELFPDHEVPFSILGTDVNRSFLKIAEKAAYRRWSFRETPEPLLKKYFLKQDGEYFTLDPQVLT